MSRAALYARYSTNLQREASIEDQFRQCERLANINSLLIVSKYSDAGLSGGTAERPGYQRLLIDARARQFDIVIAEDVSRLWRNRATYGQDSAELEDLGLHLMTCVGDDTRRDGWGLMLTIKAAMAEYQRREISYRTRRALEGLALAGSSTGGKTYGYRGTEPYEPEAAVVRQIFLRSAHGAGPWIIARELNKAGIHGPRAHYWDGSAVKYILANPLYTGKMLWGRTVASGGARDSKRRRSSVRSGGPLVSRLVAPIL